MCLRFREDKTTQAAARLLKSGGGEMPYISLIKLLYFADRKALVELGRPISYDLFVSMPKGPVLSRTFDLIASEPDPSDDRPSYWRQYISEPRNYTVALLSEPPNGQLSPAEEEVLDQVFQEFGHFDRWTLVRLSHELPEWSDPHGSSVPIAIRSILVHQGVSSEDAGAIIRDLEAETAAESLLE